MLTPKCSPLIERPAAAADSSTTLRPSAASSGAHIEGSQRRRSSEARAIPPSQTSKGSWTGSGEIETSATRPAGPLWLTVSPVHSRRSSGSTSSIAAPRAAGTTPTASRSGAVGEAGHEG